MAKKPKMSHRTEVFELTREIFLSDSEALVSDVQNDPYVIDGIRYVELTVKVIIYPATPDTREEPGESMTWEWTAIEDQHGNEISELTGEEEETLDDMIRSWYDRGEYDSYDEPWEDYPTYY